MYCEINAFTELHSKQVEKFDSSVMKWMNFCVESKCSYYLVIRKYSYLISLACLPAQYAIFLQYTNVSILLTGSRNWFRSLSRKKVSQSTWVVNILSSSFYLKMLSAQYQAIFFFTYRSYLQLHLDTYNTLNLNYSMKIPVFSMITQFINNFESG